MSQEWAFAGDRAGGNGEEPVGRRDVFPSAAIVNMADSLGRILPGYFADLILLTANPLENIRHTRNIERVVKDGHLVNP